MSGVSVLRPAPRVSSPAVPDPRSHGDLFERLPIGAYRSTVEGRQLRANAALVRLNGYASEAELLAAVQDIGTEWYVDPGRREDFKVRMARDGQVTDFVSEVYRHKTRERIWVRENAHLVRADDGAPLYYEGTIEDITAAVEAQQALARSEQRFRRLTERAQVLIMVCDPAGTVHYASPAAHSLLGRAPESLCGRPLVEHLHPDDQAETTREFQALLQGRNTGVETIYRMRHADGSWRHMAALGTQALDDPAIRGVVLHHRDVTEREAAVARLRASEQRFQQAFLASPDALAITRLSDGTVLEVNPTYVAMSGCSREALLGRQTLALGLWGRPADREAFVALMRRDGRVRDFMAHYRGLDGREGVASICAEPIELDGEACVLGIARDVTQALADRQALERLNAELEQRVAERTAQLEASLAEARRMNHELQTFAYSVSHDLKAPLRALDGYSSLLLTQLVDQLDEESLGHLQRIRTATRQMARLIDDLLAYARLEQEALTPQPLAIARLVPQVLTHHAADFARLGVQPAFDLPAVTVQADPAALVMALRNLVDNALKFGARQPGPLHLAIGGEARPGELVLWVRDNGPGFDMRYHDRIFRIFQRLHRAEEVEGTGIGLALVAKAMARMGGRAWAESTPGQGASFYLALPLGREPV